MKYGKLSRRARRPDDAEGISLFPFLAVLICAAGLLIVLLVVIGRQARAQASQRAEAKQVEFHAGLKQKHEDVLWRTEQLKQSLTATQRQLTDERLVLGHLEDHSRELRGRLESLERAWKELNAAGNAAQSQAVESQLRELSAKIDRMKQQVDKARREVMAKQRSHAVVPYEGPYGTRRRPIYIECRADAVVLQPEGIEFKTPDFEGPLGPGNPLAVALRAAREYMLRTAQLDPAKAGEPYPLLLVRPLGITAYYAAREAMRSWESDFGYEMVDADWSLDFGAADPELKRVVIEEVELARMRQRRLAEAAPRYYRQLRESRGGGGEEKPQFTVTGNGVVVPYGGEVADEPSGESRYGYARRPASLTASGDGNSTGGGTNTSDGPSAGGAEGVSSTGDVANGEASMLGGGGSTPGRAVLPPLDGTAGASSGNPSGNPSGNSQNGSTGSQNGTSDGSMTGATGTMTGSSG
ncbi:MAG TPA: hypothetical protein VJL29_10720, partial [Thermoguttaceae bacterium]|nr:hypothetical protein [Thermoguttaceae bacterium]